MNEQTADEVLMEDFSDAVIDAMRKMRSLGAEMIAGGVSPIVVAIACSLSSADYFAFVAAQDGSSIEEMFITLDAMMLDMKAQAKVTHADFFEMCAKTPEGGEA